MVVKIPASKEKTKKVILSFGLHHQFLSVILLFFKITPIGTKPKPSKRNIAIDILIIIFGVSSWVAVNGLWVELPVLVNTLPESWKLASFVVVTTQLGNLGPLLFIAARKIWSQKVLEVPIIHLSLFISITCCGFLSYFWNWTTYVAGEMHSTALLALTFLLSSVDCTSSLLYLPFIANFKEQYVISYLMGTGLSGPIPGMLALVQGVSGYPECRNVSFTNVTEFGNVTEYVIETYYPPPRFSSSIYFAVLTGQMVVSWISFILLNKLPQAKREKEVVLATSRPSNPAIDQNFQSSIENEFSSSIEVSSSERDTIIKPSFTATQYFALLAVQGFICCLHSGVLLSIQTYSCLPYGSLTYHLTVILASIANPVCCFFAMFLSITSVLAIVSLAVYATCWGAYILTAALMSPTPPLVDNLLGTLLVVLAWVMVSGTVAFIKARIATILRCGGGQTALYRCGVVTQIGAATGAITTFIVIQFTTLFRSFSPCS